MHIIDKKNNIKFNILTWKYQKFIQLWKLYKNTKEYNIKFYIWSLQYTSRILLFISYVLEYYKKICKYYKFLVLIITL